MSIPESDVATGLSPGADAAAVERKRKLAEWERRTTSWIIVSALLPIATAFGPNEETGVKDAINVVCWLVFVVDLGVHMKLSPGYLRTGRGKFDLSIVVITAPWFLFTGGNSQFVVLARLARLGRVVMASTRSNKLKHLGNQLGSAALYALSLILACSILVKALDPEESFPTFGDAIWWGFVTFTTVGYGDFYPVTTWGRFFAIVLMLGGVAFLGTLAGTLSAFFGVGTDGKPVQYDEHGEVIVVTDEPDGTVEIVEGPTSAPALPGSARASPRPPHDNAALAAEVAALRETVHALVAKLDERGPAR